MTTKHDLSETRRRRLQIFLIVSVAIHIIVACSTVIPYIVKQRIEARRAEAARLAKLAEREKTKRDLQAASRAMAREKIEASLESEAHDFLIDSMDDIAFDELWQSVLASLSDDLDAVLAELEAANFQLSNADLAELMSNLRTRELEKLLEAV
ncbi:MAG: hypothetical protein O3A51_01725, partial [Verrucomicrobia bacterium]|nr:hypothetical protein [Verrucomicrobiota bacterium]